MNETTTTTSGRAGSGDVVARRRSCFFCGQTNGPFTNEHVWPKWVSGLLCGGRRNSFDHHCRYLKATDDVLTKKWTKPSLEVTTKICESCNNQWLSDFEDRIKPFASPLIVGGVAALALAPESRALLAAWAYKLALLLEVSHPDKSTDFFTPLADRLQFRRTTSAHGLVRQVGSATAAPADVRGPAKARTIGAREDVPPGFSRRSATRTMEPDSRDGGDLKPMTPIKNSIAGFTGITGMPIRMGAPTYRDRATALGCAEARSNAHLPRAGVPGAHNPGPRNRARETITRSYRLHIGVENRPNGGKRQPKVLSPRRPSAPRKTPANTGVRPASVSLCPT